MGFTNCRPRALIVDDDSAVRNSVSLMLLSMGIESDVVGDGVAALEHISASRYDLAIIDIGLPDVDGMLLSEEIHRHDALMPVVITSGVTIFAERQKNFAAAFIEKPVSSAQFRQIINAVLPRQGTQNHQML